MNKNKRVLLVLMFGFIVILMFNPKSINSFKYMILGESHKIVNIIEVELPHSNQILHTKQKDAVLQYWDGILYSYNLVGEQNWSINIGVINPTIEVSNNSIYILDRGKNQIIKLNANGEIVYRSILTKPIKLLKCGDGRYAIAYHMPDNNLFRNVSILNHEGKVVGDIAVSEGEIINSLVSESNDRIILHTVSVRNGKIEGKLLHYNLKGELTKLDITEEEIVTSMVYDSKENLVLVYEDKLVGLKNDQEKRWEVGTDTINRIVASEEHIVTYTSSEGRGGIIQGRGRSKVNVLDFNGRMIGENINVDKIMGIDILDNDIIAYSNRTIYLLNNKGDIILEYKISGDLQEVFILPQKHLAVITKEKLSFVKIQ